ncbi:MAG: hypothetical protein K1X83_04750 [Oligoflexia bacterium]|nr:hypothetical protein [Oligoflexia bacterium]
MEKPRNLTEAIKQAKDYLAAMSGREKLLIGVGLIVLLGLALVQIYGSISAGFSSQSVEITRLERDLNDLSTLLDRYTKVKSRRDAIENQYKSVEINEGVYSHLENLIKKFALVDSGFTISENPQLKFGGNYLQLPFVVKFTTTNLKALVDFLKQIVEGPKPLVISRLNLTRSRGRDSLDVELEVSSIKRAS